MVPQTISSHWHLPCTDESTIFVVWTLLHGNTVGWPIESQSIVKSTINLTSSVHCQLGIFRVFIFFIFCNSKLCETCIVPQSLGYMTSSLVGPLALFVPICTNYFPSNPFLVWHNIIQMSLLHLALQVHRTRDTSILESGLLWNWWCHGHITTLAQSFWHCPLKVSE